MATKRPEVLLLVGMSGAGRSASSNVFEDLGYYVIENLPAELVESVVQSNDVTETNKWVLTPKQTNLFLWLFTLFTGSSVVKMLTNIRLDS